MTERVVNCSFWLSQRPHWQSDNLKNTKLSNMAHVLHGLMSACMPSDCIIFDLLPQYLQSAMSMMYVQASVLEVYNDDYNDLLGKGLPPGEKLNVHHDAQGVTTVDGLTLVDVTQPKKVESLLTKAKEKRAVGATTMNDHSSRSHMVFTLRIDGANEGTGQLMHGEHCTGLLSRPWFILASSQMALYLKSYEVYV